MVESRGSRDDSTAMEFPFVHQPTKTNRLESTIGECS